MAWDAETSKPAPKPEEYFKTVTPEGGEDALKVAICGPPGSGKTYFCCSSAVIAPPTYIIDTQMSANKIARENFPDETKRGDLKVFEVKVVDEDILEIDYAKSFDQIAASIFALKDVQKGTICIDSVSDLYSWLNAWVEATAEQRTKIGTPQRLEWGRRTEKFRLLLFRLLSRPTHTIVTAEVQPVFTKGGEEMSSVPPVPRWFKPTEHWCDLIIEQRKLVAGPGNVKYVSTLTKSRPKRALDYEFTDITFKSLADFLFQRMHMKARGITYDDKGSVRAQSVSSTVV